MIAFFRIFCLCFIWTSVDAQEQRKAFADKLVSLVLTKQIAPKDMFGITDAVVSEIIKGTSYNKLDFQSIVIQNGPPEKVFMINNVKNELEKCLEGKKRKEKAGDVINLVTPDIEKSAKPLYAKFVKLAAQNKKDGKNDAAIRSTLYEQGAKELKKELAQTIMTNIAKRLDCPVLQCTVSSVKVLIKFGNFKVAKANCPIS